MLCSVCVCLEWGVGEGAVPRKRERAEKKERERDRDRDRDRNRDREREVGAQELWDVYREGTLRGRRPARQAARLLFVAHQVGAPRACRHTQTPMHALTHTQSFI